MKKRNGKIDFFKFVFSLIIVFHHSKMLVGEENSLFLGGSFAVEFFFIVSGCLMMASIKRASEAHSSLLLGKETRNYIKKKVKPLFPEMLLSYCIALVFVSYAQSRNIIGLFMRSFHSLMLWDMSGLREEPINTATWYISAMLLCMAILYPLIRKFPDIMLSVVIPLSILLILGYFNGNRTSPRGPTEWLGLTYKGNLRAFAELGIGICCYPLIQIVKKTHYTIFGRILLTITEILCYISLIVYMQFKEASGLDYFFIPVFAIAIVISFSHKSIGSHFFDNKVTGYLAKYSLSLYLCHYFYAENLHYLLPAGYNNQQAMAVYLILSFTTALIVMLFSDILRKHYKDIKGFAKKLLVKST